ncbi:hypothetical protein HMPREF9622_02881 [Cutibacterium modestum HL037PA3]|uniref:Uncharacterized protein n=1 Tax=Cutibacterium modestum HL044PA1 TaxID=765109 RepID=A0ABP2K592_9ACTN|nr:hypothetical protein HMPREF9607_01778 [Cutibacterium modestum HL044PA1]EFT14114.1 hypothetical protein HMPREF9622_02881 [Cutibacterium modestum HL037PA3]EGG25656.1 hypothetical protein PA08_2607 [Cutibacterium modestum P08]
MLVQLVAVAIWFGAGVSAIDSSGGVIATHVCHEARGVREDSAGSAWR